MHVTYLLNIFCLVHAKVEFKSQAWILWCLPQMLCALQCAGTIQIHPLSTPAGLCSGGGASSYTSFVLPWASPLLPLVSNRQWITQLEAERMSIHSFSPSRVIEVWWCLLDKVQSSYQVILGIAIIPIGFWPSQVQQYEQFCWFQGLQIQMFIKYGWWIREKYLLSIPIAILGRSIHSVPKVG